MRSKETGERMENEIFIIEGKTILECSPSQMKPIFKTVEEIRKIGFNMNVYVLKHSKEAICKQKQ